MARDPFNFTWIEEGVILAGSIPSTPAHIEQLANMGIKAIISLTRRDLCEYPSMTTALNDIYYTHQPIVDNGIPDDKTLERILDELDFAFSQNMPVYVHCRGGIGRTGLVLIAWYVLRRKLTLSEARNKVKVRRNWQGNASADDGGSPQREWIDALGNV